MPSIQCGHINYDFILKITKKSLKQSLFFLHHLYKIKKYISQKYKSIFFNSKCKKILFPHHLETKTVSKTHKNNKFVIMLDIP